MPVRNAKKPRPAPKQPSARPAPPVRPVKPPPPPLRRYFVRCTFVGEMQKRKVDGSFRFLLEATDATAVRARLEPAVRKLRRLGEIPSRCDVYVEFVLEVADLPRGIVVDFERWAREPRQFEHGCTTFSEVCALHEHGAPEPAFRFGTPREPAAPSQPLPPTT